MSKLINELNFLNYGILSYKNLVSKEKCVSVRKKIKLPREISRIFSSEIDYKKNPELRKTNPGKGVQNLAEELDLNFIEKNKDVIEILNSVLGKNYEIILKKFIIGVPKNKIPSWIFKITSKELVGNLNKFILPKYRKSTYFYGIDYHMDYIDVPNNKGDFITLYVYLDNVTKNSSPLNVVIGSHKFGATKFPHNIKKKKKKISYATNSKNKEIFKIKQLTGSAGDLNLWSCYTLHGTSPMKAKKPRISLRYLIKAKNPKNNSLINKLRNNIKYKKIIKTTRTDIKKKKLLNKKIEYAIQSKNRVLV
jgi:hypothetical protein